MNEKSENWLNLTKESRIVLAHPLLDNYQTLNRGERVTEKEKVTLAKILAKIKLTPRVYKGPAKKKEGERYQMLCRKLPVPLIQALQSLEDQPLTHHLEKAIKLYLLANGKEIE